LTRNEKDKQGKGGGPYTNEAVGAENYGTIAYVVESPHEKGHIWVGTDDGLVQLTKDGGKTWNNVTPKNLKECLVNAIDISPHDPATAYIATTRYKFNDFTPALYKTTDYGKTWMNITNGIPYGAYTRVVREDEVRKDLLFAGTETGVYLSWDGGKNWKPLQTNLPLTPINDLIIKHDDIIVATSGRSFWILDDLEIIRQYKPNPKAIKVYKSPDVTMVNGGSPLNRNSADFDGTNPLQGVNPATLGVIYYHLPEVKEDEVLTMEIKDAAGNVVRKFSSELDPDFQSYAGGPPAAPVLSKKEGLNRFVWDLRYPIMPGAPKAYIEARFNGHKVMPGTYTIHLKYGNEQARNSIIVKKNPHYTTTKEDYQAYHEFMSEVESKVTNMHNMVNAVMKAKVQIKSVLADLPEKNKYREIKEKGNALIDEMTAWDDDMVQRKSKAYDDVENFPNKFTANYLFMVNQCDSDLLRIGQPARDRKQELDRKWMKLKQRGESLLQKDLPQFNDLLWKHKIGAVWVGAS